VSYVFHPDAEAEHLESVAYFESKRPGLGTSYLVEFEKRWDTCVSHLNDIRLKGNLTCGIFKCNGSRTQYFIVMSRVLFKYWRLLIIGGVHNIGRGGSNRDRELLK